ncbi:MAG TPA: lactate racemase domain-containing protein [Pirellulales bacterium]|nr:lactate racemase domain-containing protein [Pirellulales bacterium]
MPVHPKFFRVRQTFEAPRIDDIPGTVQAELSRIGLQQKVRPGQTVAITAGSRGIANIDIIIKAAVQFFQGIGAKPFIVPSMGSHGGGTAEGQLAILEGYGITEEFCGCPIKSSMETVVVCQTAEGFPVHFDKHASQADHVLVAGRVKPHTDFVGEVESGLMKMMLIGLGKHEGAKVYHRAILDYSFPQIVRSVAGHVLERCRIVAGLAIVENGYDETAKIAAVGAAELEARERELLKLARKWMPKLPFPVADILFIDELGKNISGAGVDTNVVGRKFQFHQAAPDEYPKVKRIVIRGLTEETHGNASGIGLAEFCTTRAMNQVDPVKTRINCLTSGNVAACMVPVNFDTDREILDAALPTIGLTQPIDAKILWIRNTLHLAEVECSQAYLDEAQNRDDLEVLTQLRDLPFGSDGNLPPCVDDLSPSAVA